jgi:hypothetical protein
MGRSLRIRIAVECFLAVISSAALVLSFATPQWIEEAFGIRPDANTGATEWMMALGLLLSTAFLMLRVRLDRRALSMAGR